VVVDRVNEKLSIKGDDCDVYANLDPKVESYVPFYQAVSVDIDHN
jgi:hypothetical protein